MSAWLIESSTVTSVWTSRYNTTAWATNSLLYRSGRLTQHWKDWSAVYVWYGEQASGEAHRHYIWQGRSQRHAGTKETKYSSYTTSPSVFTKIVQTALHALERMHALPWHEHNTDDSRNDSSKLVQPSFHSRIAPCAWGVCTTLSVSLPLLG